ncbi:MAG: DoxX family protein [Chlamydiae bacterium]|nr:DoxX family protein [Chlamydiota bacterium]
MRFKNSLLHFIDTIYSPFIQWGGNLQSLFLLYMRITWGHQLALIGWGKIHALEKTAEFFSSLSFPYPYFLSYFVGTCEFVCGICLIIGFASRIVAIPVIIIMLTALSTAHAPDISNFRFLFEPRSLVNQPPYPFLITGFLVLTFGPGRISLDAWLKRWARKQPRY